MKIVITGSRDTNDRRYAWYLLDKYFPKDALMINGRAKSGIDLFTYQWAINNKIQLIERYADWDRYGKSAGFIRNQVMIDEADACFAIWDGYSKGTADCINRALARKLKVDLFLL